MYPMTYVRVPSTLHVPSSADAVWSTWGGTLSPRYNVQETHPDPAMCCDYCGTYGYDFKCKSCGASVRP